MFAFLLGFATINAEEIPDGIMPQRRAVVGTGATTSSSPTTSQTTPDSSTSTPPTTSKQTTNNNSPSGSTTIPVTSTNPDGSQTTAHVKSTSLTSDHTSDKTTDTNTAKVQTTTGSHNPVVKVGSTTINPKTLEHKTTVREPLVTKATKHTSFTSYWTSDGHAYSSVYRTENVFESTTGFATATIAPQLANKGGNGSNLSTNTKSIIGGVVGGIGGAILVGGLAFVLWRLYGKKKNQDVQQDDLYSSDSLSAQKRLSRNTLDTATYSNPNGAVNTASNF